MSNYAYAEHHAHGLTLKKSLTFDTKTGKTYALKDLFKSNSDYVSELSKMVKKQIKDRDIPIINSFSKISKDQDFYMLINRLCFIFNFMKPHPIILVFQCFRFRSIH